MNPKGWGSVPKTLHYRNCHNCDGTDHQGFDCPLAKADCVVCGIGAGHIDKHCLAQSHREIPSSISEHVKERILKRRAIYVAKKETGAVAAHLPSHADEDELIAWLDDQEDCDDCDDE